MPSPIRSTTQSSLDIEDITNNLVLLKDGGAAIVIKIKAVNFALLSEEEQEAIIYAYAALLNSLSFPIQVLVRSQKKDITNYIKLLKNQEIRQLNPVLKTRLTAYRQFVETVVKERNVLDKTFFIVIPFFATELGLSPSTAGKLLPGTKKPTSLPFDKSYIIQKALNSLEPKRDHLLRQLPRLNLSAKQLQTQELIQLFYTIYNPDAVEGVQTLSPPQYHAPLTRSAAPLKKPASSNTPPPAQPAPPKPTPPPAPASINLTPPISQTPNAPAPQPPN